MKALKDRPSFDELQQDQASHWQRVQAQRVVIQEASHDLRGHAWKCLHCFQSHAGSVSICPSCHSARILEGQL